MLISSSKCVNAINRTSRTHLRIQLPEYITKDNSCLDDISVFLNISVIIDMIFVLFLIFCQTVEFEHMTTSTLIIAKF